MLSALVVAALLAADGGDRPALAVLDLTANGVPKEQAAALTDALTQELARRGFFQVIASKDIQTLLGVERQKALLGCGESSCTTELAGALGARFVLSGSLSKLGEAVQVSLQLLDSSHASTVARSTRLAKTLDELVEQLPWLAAEATATPLPPAPSRAAPITLFAVGGASLATGLVLGINALSRWGVLQADLTQANNEVFKSITSYKSELSTINLFTIIAVSTAVAGAALIATGIVLWRSGPSTGSAAVTLVPTPNGVAFAGVWP